MLIKNNDNLFKYIKLNLKVFLTNEVWKEAFFINFYCVLKGINNNDIEDWRVQTLKEIYLQKSKEDLDKTKSNIGKIGANWDLYNTKFSIALIRDACNTSKIKNLIKKMEQEFIADIEFLSNHVIVYLHVIDSYKNEVNQDLEFTDFCYILNASIKKIKKIKKYHIVSINFTFFNDAYTREQFFEELLKRNLSVSLIFKSMDNLIISDTDKFLYFMCLSDFILNDILIKYTSEVYFTKSVCPDYSSNLLKKFKLLRLRINSIYNSLNYVVITEFNKNWADINDHLILHDFTQIKNLDFEQSYFMSKAKMHKEDLDANICNMLYNLRILNQFNIDGSLLRNIIKILKFINKSKN